MPQHDRVLSCLPLLLCRRLRLDTWAGQWSDAPWTKEYIAGVEVTAISRSFHTDYSSNWRLGGHLAEATSHQTHLICWLARVCSFCDINPASSAQHCARRSCSHGRRTPLTRPTTPGARS